jgi:copper(I)-binding protein
MRMLVVALASAMALSLAPAVQAEQQGAGHEKMGDKTGRAMTKKPAKTATIVVEQAWARASLTAIGAAYVSVRNTGITTDQLIGVRTPVAKRAELHTHLMENGIMKMRPLKAIELNPGAPAVMRPGGNHIMLMGLKHKLKRGERFPITLRFAKAGEITVMATVAGPGARGPAASPHEHHERDDWDKKGTY